MTQEELVGFQRDAITMLHSLISAKPDSELAVKDAQVKLQAAALLLQAELPMTESDIRERIGEAVRAAQVAGEEQVAREVVLPHVH